MIVGQHQRAGNMAWCLCSCDGDMFLLTAAPVGVKMSLRYLKIAAYLFDEDGFVYTEPVSRWRVKFKKKITFRNPTETYLSWVARGLSSGGGSPYDYRDSYLIYDDMDSVPMGNKLVLK